MERVFTLKKRFLFPALLFVFIAIIFTIGCTNHLLKPHQSDLSILVKLEKSSGRNITTGDYQITTWIENRDGTESHHQEINSTAGADASIIFEELAIGSEINIHLEVVETGTTGKKLVGTSDWITVNEGTNVVVIVLREDSDTGEIDGPVAGDDPEDEGDPVLTSIAVQYDSGEYQLVNTNIDPSKITITQHFDDGSTNKVKASDLSSDYNIAFAANASINSSIGNVPATVTHVKTQITAIFTIPVKYTLAASHLTLNGTTSVEQNGTLELTANYPDTTYQIYDGNGGSTTYQVKDNLNISWTGATAQSDAWKATANTQTTGQQTATVKLTSKDEWCVTTSEITARHEYEVTAATTAGGITDENSLLEAINQAQDGDSITIPNEITITNTITVNKNIIIDGNKTGTLFRSNKGTITGPMFEVSNSGNLTLQNITLDGQYNNDFYGGGNNPFIINNGGTLTVSSSTLTNNRMSPTGAAYGSIPQLYASAAIYSAGTTVITKSEISDVSSNNNTKGIVYGVTGSLTIIDTNITLPTSYNGNALYLESAVSYNINNKDSGLSQSYKSITPDSP